MQRLCANIWGFTGGTLATSDFIVCRELPGTLRDDRRLGSGVDMQKKISDWEEAKQMAHESLRRL